MAEETNEEIRQRVATIEVLNDNGIGIIYIDNTYYVFTDFLPVDAENHYITLSGQNITSLIQSTVSITGFDKGRITEIIQQIAVMPIRRREFSPRTQWIKYAPKY